MPAKHATAQDLLQRMRAVALREGAPGQIPGQARQERPEQPSEAERLPESTAGPVQEERTQRRVRYTLDLDRSQHRFLRQFALDTEVDASAVMRALLRLLAQDPVLAEQVRALVARDFAHLAGRAVPGLSRAKR